MSLAAVGIDDLAHEMGHAFSLQDRVKGELTSPDGEVNLMCSGVPNFCADGHVHGHYLDQHQLDQGRVGHSGKWGRKMGALDRSRKAFFSRVPRPRLLRAGPAFPLAVSNAVNLTSML